MRTTILQHMNATIDMPHNNDFETPYAGTHEIPGFAELTFMGDVKPDPLEDILHLGREDIGVPVNVPVHSAATYKILCTENIWLGHVRPRISQAAVPFRTHSTR